MPKSASDYIAEIKELQSSANAAIAQAKKAFEESLVEITGGPAKVVKEWARDIKADPAKESLAYQHAEATGLFDVYVDELKNNRAHRVCYRTFVVNSYIYYQLSNAEGDSSAIDQLLNDL